MIYPFTDCNNLYGFCMMHKLPHKNFRWLREDELTALDIHSFNADGNQVIHFCICFYISQPYCFNLKIRNVYQPIIIN